MAAASALRPVLRQLEWGRTFAKQPTVVRSDSSKAVWSKVARLPPMVKPNATTSDVT